MKKQLIPLLIILNSVCWGQGSGYRLTSANTNNICTCNPIEIYIDSTTIQDSLTAEKFFDDSLGNHYMVEYRYVEPREIGKDSAGIRGLHAHFIAVCTIVLFKGNNKITVLGGYKAIYSTHDCASDNSALWLNRLYSKNKK